MSPIVDQGVVNSIPAWSHTFVEIDHEICSTVSQEGLRKYVHKVMVNRFVKLAKENVWLLI